MTQWNKVAGDIGDYITVTLGGIANLDAVSTVKAHVWTRPADATELDGAVLDSAGCTIRIELGDDEGWLAEASAGRYNVEHVLTFLDGSELTWPQMDRDLIVVRSDGDPIVP